jgi:hypothetical protein
MSTQEETEINGCAICMEEATIGKCVSSGVCVHYACRDCWFMTGKCFVCQVKHNIIRTIVIMIGDKEEYRIRLDNF